MFTVTVFVSFPAVLLACSSLPPGQEKHLPFQVDGISTLPLQFSRSTDQTKWEAPVPGFAASQEEALKNVRQYVKKAVMRTVKAEAKKAGIENLVGNIASQIIPKVYYPIMLCGGSSDGTKPCAELTSGYCCVIDQTNITGIMVGETKQELSEGYQRIIVNLAITNAIIGGWSSDTWKIKLLDVESRLRSGAYGQNFKRATVRIL